MNSEAPEKLGTQPVATPPTAAQDTADAAHETLRHLRAAVDAAIAALASRCAPEGNLDAGLLEAGQLAAYELAWAAAELLAAEQLVQSDDSQGSALDTRLAWIFVADATAAIFDRLERAAADLPAVQAQLPDLRAMPAWQSLRSLVFSSAYLESVGQAVIAARGQVGELSLGEDHALAQASFRRFSEQQVAPWAERIHREDLLVPEALLGPLRDMGVFGLGIPQRYGGSAPDHRDDTLLMVVVTEALSEASLGAAGSLITRPEILARALLAGGTEVQRAQWLPRLAIGEPLCAIAMTEPDCGSDLAACRLRATPVEGGWHLNGSKTWCTFAGKAGVLMVVARTAPDPALGYRGLSVLLAEKPAFDTHEFEVLQDGGGRLSGRAIATIGYRGMHSYELAFQDYFVPQENLLGGEAGLGKGFYYTLAGMVGGRMQTAARACGVMRAALRAAAEYCADRKVFGAALGDLPLPRARLAQMAARWLACRRLTYAMASVVDAGGGRMEASLAKLLACRSAELITRDALQLHGGMGYAEETPVSRYFVDARVLSIFEGAEETLAIKVVARGLVEQALVADANTISAVSGEAPPALGNGPKSVSLGGKERNESIASDGVRP